MNDEHTWRQRYSHSHAMDTPTSWKITDLMRSGTNQLLFVSTVRPETDRFDANMSAGPQIEHRRLLLMPMIPLSRAVWSVRLAMADHVRNNRPLLAWPEIKTLQINRSPKYCNGYDQGIDMNTDRKFQASDQFCSVTWRN